MPRSEDPEEKVIHLARARAGIDQEAYPPPLEGVEGWMTRSVHGGELPGSPPVPIHQANAVGAIHAYSRYSNPTVQAFEAKFRELEGGAGTIATACGMAAVSQTLLGLLGSGDRLVTHRDLFVGVRSLMAEFLPRYGIEVVAVDFKDLEALARTLETPTRAIFFESLSHPYLEVLDLPAILELARRSRALAIVDNTALTPCLLRPFEHGADLVLHSATKYIGGHGDAMGGVITAGREELARTLRKARRVLGGILSPMNAYTLLRGLKTLPLRMERHSANALAVARFLEGHPRVARVHYPGLPSSPGHRTAVSYLESFGGLVGFELAEGADKERFGQALRLCKARLSFGETGTVVLLQDEVPVNRISVGLEAAEDLIRDLARALEAA